MSNFLSQIDPQKLFEKSYLLETNPSVNGFYLYLAIIFGLFLMISLYLIFKKPKKIYQKLYQKFITLFLVIGFFGLLLIFFRWQGIPYLSSRIMFLLLVLIFTIWFIFIYYYWLIILPKEMKAQIAKEKFEKYLPGGR